MRAGASFKVYRRCKRRATRATAAGESLHDGSISDPDVAAGHLDEQDVVPGKKDVSNVFAYLIRGLDLLAVTMSSSGGLGDGGRCGVYSIS